MTTERAIRIMSGGLILLSLALGVEASPLFVSLHFLWLAAFVGANLFQSGFTGFCPAEIIMLKLGMRHGDSISLSH
jgi:hypothetical protein